MPLPGWTIEAVEVPLSIREASTHLVSRIHKGRRGRSAAATRWAAGPDRSPGSDVDTERGDGGGDRAAGSPRRGAVAGCGLRRAARPRRAHRGDRVRDQQRTRRTTVADRSPGRVGIAVPHQSASDGDTSRLGENGGGRGFAGLEAAWAGLSPARDSQRLLSCPVARGGRPRRDGGVRENPAAETQEIRLATIWTVTAARPVSDTATMSPNPTVAKTVTVKYSDAIRDRLVEKLPGVVAAIR